MNEEGSISVNELLQICAANDSDGAAYYSRVQEALGERLVISWPTREGLRLMIRKDQALDCCVVRDGVPYEFTGTVCETQAGPPPLVTLVRAGGITKVQRRQDFRMKCLIPVEVSGSFRDPRDGSETTLSLRIVTSDLSAGGMVICHQNLIPDDCVVEVKLGLPDGGSPVRAACRVVHSEGAEKPNFYRTGLLFLSLAESERARIVRYIYREQLKGVRG